MLKNLPANAGDAKDASLIFASGRYPGVGNGNLIQYSCLENPMGYRPWGCKELDMTEQLSTHTPAIYFTHDSIYMLMLFSSEAPLSLSPTLFTSPFPISAYPFLPCKYICKYHLSWFHIHALVCNTFYSFWLTSPCITGSRFIDLTQMDSTFVFFIKIKRYSYYFCWVTTQSWYFKILSSFQLLSFVRLFVTPWTLACQSSLSITNTGSLSCPSSGWCHPTISSSLIPFSSHL